MATLFSSTHSFHDYHYKFPFLLLFMFVILIKSCAGYGAFGFDIHHRFSDPVKRIFGVDGLLPVKDSVPYFQFMAHRDRVIHGRRLATSTGGDTNKTPLTFYYGNETYQYDSLGFLYYANISVGTPSLSFLVALDTGSNLMWLPCNCFSCVRSLSTPSGRLVELNIYSPNASSTSEKVPCYSTLCSKTQSHSCLDDQSNCPYQLVYLSEATSSTGYLVQDLLHLITDNSTQSKAVDAKITFGCGLVETGSFLTGGAPNGLLGLAISNVSVPSTLEQNGYISASFSMCFSRDGIGRISFGDKGSTGQAETPFNQGHPASSSLYNIRITQTIMGGNDSDLEFGAIFDTGTSFTYLNDPAYTLIAESFNNLVNETRHHPSTSDDIPFDYCYDLSANQTMVSVPTVNMVMSGTGDYFNVTHPIVIVQLQDGSSVFCLGMIKSRDVNIIGQNFMAGYRIVFDRERMILGWKPSNCYDNEDTSTPAVSPNTAVPPATAVNSNATSTSPPGVNHSPQLKPFTFTSMMVMFLFFSWWLYPKRYHILV